MFILVDTNIFLDLLLERGELSDIAEEFFSNVFRIESKICLSSTSLRDIGYVAQQQFHDRKKSREVQMKAYQLCHKVITLSDDAAIEALYSDVKDYENALLVEIAKKEIIDLIVTNNIKDFKNASFPVWTPKYFNEVIARQCDA